jgi:ketosteroid isomerase-like protein
MSIKPQVLDLIQLIEKGMMLEAITRYYDENVSTQENTSAPTVGRETVYKQEAAFFASLASVKFTLGSVVVDGDRAAINWVFDYTTADGQRYRMDEIAYQTWRNGKVVYERYVYDSASLALAA